MSRPGDRARIWFTSLRSSLRGSWGEHGAWVVALVSAGSGLVMAGKPGLPAFLLVPAVACLTAAKGLAVRLRRTGKGMLPTAAFITAAMACAAPAALLSPAAYAVLAAVGAPFSLLYFAFAGSPRWTRSLGTELGGTFLLAAATGLPILAVRPRAFGEASAAWVFMGLSYLPGVLRARIPKDPGPGLRIACAAFAFAALGVLVALAACGRLPWWALAAAPPILKDVYRAWAVPDWTTKRLGLNLTAKAVYVGLVVSLGWGPWA